jgi:hypothetical protein
MKIKLRHGDTYFNDPYNLFDFFTDKFLEIIVKESNVYAFKKVLKSEDFKNSSTPRKHMSSWKTFSPSEMKVFFRKNTNYGRKSTSANKIILVEK